jgi:hypothetical protein
MKNIALVECWFGRFPDWHNLYLLTCSHNPDVDWFIFHDQVPPKKYPKNVKFHYLKKEDLERQSSSLLGKKISIKNGYKVCDLRPTYGKLFEEFLKDYKFWGYGDSDIFFGQISNFIDEAILDKYDVITSCRCSVTGQFTIFRNSGILKSLYEIIPNYADAFNEDTLSAMDEIPLNQALIEYKKEPIRVYRRQIQIHDIGSEEWEDWAKRLEIKEKGNLDDWFWEGGAVEWNNGKLIHLATKKEAMFFHFMYWKKVWNIPKFPYWDKEIKHFKVSENGVEIVFEKSELMLNLYFYMIYMIPLKSSLLFKNVIRFAKKVKRKLKKYFKTKFSPQVI